MDLKNVLARHLGFRGHPTALIVVVMVVGALSVALPNSSYAELTDRTPSARASPGNPRVEPKINNHCAFFPRSFMNLESIYIDIRLPPDAGGSQCRGREKECAKTSDVLRPFAGASEAVKRQLTEQEIVRLKALNERYPHQLDQSELAPLFQHSIAAALSRLTEHSPCEFPTPVVVDQSNATAHANAKNSLTYIIGVDLVDTVPSRIAILTGTYFRRDPGYTDYYGAVPVATAFPLNLSDDRIKATLAKFAQQAALTPTPASVFQE